MPKFNFLLFIILLLMLPAGPLHAQTTNEENAEQNDESHVPDQVDIEPTADDEQIRQRLDKILNATGWYQGVEVLVNDGVVFLEGEAETESHKVWAGNLARNTQDVTAVVNKITIVGPDIWDYDPAINSVRQLWKNILRALPTVIFALLVFLIFWGISFLVSKTVQSYLKKRAVNVLLQQIISRMVAFLVFLIGIYIIFYIANLTRVALTVLGGTGLLGIILGIAFREITENFLASIFLSIQRPFQTGDLVEIDGNTGIIQRLTIRATVLLTLEGNHMQIPNSTVYKSNIVNFTSNPNQRVQFTIQIGYNDDFEKAQELGLNILRDHSAVLSEPEPWVLIDELAPLSVIIRFYYWVDGGKHNTLKVNSSIKKLTAKTYENAGIKMPDGRMRMIFPDGVPLTKDDKTETEAKKEQIISEKKTDTSEETMSQKNLSAKAEGDLHNNEEELKEQARKSRIPEEGGDLL